MILVRSCTTARIFSNHGAEAAWQLIGLCFWVVRCTETLLKAAVLCNSSGVAQPLLGGKTKYISNTAVLSPFIRVFTSFRATAPPLCSSIYLAKSNRRVEARNSHSNVHRLLARRRRKSSNGPAGPDRYGGWFGYKFWEFGCSPRRKSPYCKSAGLCVSIPVVKLSLNCFCSSNLPTSARQLSTCGRNATHSHEID